MVSKTKALQGFVSIPERGWGRLEPGTTTQGIKSITFQSLRGVGVGWSYIGDPLEGTFRVLDDNYFGLFRAFGEAET